MNIREIQIASAIEEAFPRLSVAACVWLASRIGVA